jgi:thiamine-phosphate pyrophosphorylase
VVFRHDDAPGRVALGRRIAQLCRERRLRLVVSGDARLAAALGAGLHLCGGRRDRPIRVPGLLTSSAHGIAELRRARGARAAACFLSPAFPTASHPGARALGPLRWARLAATAAASPASIIKPPLILALGGVNGATLARLPQRLCAGAGAIGALGACGAKATVFRNCHDEATRPVAGLVWPRS